MTTFYITKYVLSGGIFAIESEAVTNHWHQANQFSVKDTRPGAASFHSFAEKEAFVSFDDARADALARRDKKVASLKKQIAKLEKLTFVVPKDTRP